MAKPIAPTPILKGKEAEEFLKEVDTPILRKVPKEEIEKGKKLFDLLVRKGPLAKHAV